MKLLFVGVFDKFFASTNTSQLLCLNSLVDKVVGYNYREKAIELGFSGRDDHLIQTIEDGSFDLVLFSKCNRVNYSVFEQATSITKTCLWFMDPLASYDLEMKTKTGIVHYFCCDKKDVLEEARKINENSFHVCEGFDTRNDFPCDVAKEHEVTFLGNVYGDRAELLKKIQREIHIKNSAYGKEHAIEVSKSIVNLNICTDRSASDRVYKVLAAKGFLISNDWHGREEMFEDGKDLVIFDTIQDLNEKIEFYLANQELANKIAKSGYNKVQKYTRLNWAKEIVRLYEQIN